MLINDQPFIILHPPTPNPSLALEKKKRKKEIPLSSHLLFVQLYNTLSLSSLRDRFHCLQCKSFSSSYCTKLKNGNSDAASFNS